jgi:hypothetical protein
MKTYVVRLSCDVEIRAKSAFEASEVARRSLQVVGHYGPMREPKDDDVIIVKIGHPTYRVTRGKRMTNSS